MENMTFDRLLLLLLFILLPVLNWLLGQVLKRRLPQPRSEQQPQPPLPIVVQRRTPITGKPTQRERTASPPLVAPQRPRRASALRSLLQRKPEIRRGIILMTVLGPCRALEPPE